MSSEYPSTVLLLVRHGQARARDGSYGPETGLSELGRLQAAAIARILAREASSATVYTSPWPRAVETANPLCAALDLRAVVDPRLAEMRFGPGTLESAQSRPDLMAWKPEHRGVESGETLGEFAARVAAFCDEVVERHLGAGVVVVTHSGTIDAAIRWAVGLTPSSPWQHDFDIANGSITEVEFWPHGMLEGGSPRYAALGRIGDVRHLGDLVSDL